MTGMTSRARRGAPRGLRAAGIVLALASVLAGAGPAAAQSDPLTPPPDLDAAGVPVPPDGTAILGENNPPPMDMMAIPEPPGTCAGLAAAVRQEGALLVPTGGGNAQRYVRDVGFCAEGQSANPAWVPTPDNARCFVGYTCGTANNDGGK
ncbi:hypothetical protein [Xanthobacter sediminis]